MKQLIYILTILLLTSCGDINTAKDPAASTNTRSNVQLAVIAPFNHPDRLEDTLTATVDKTDFLITPAGKMFWGKDPADTIHLLTNLIVEAARLHVRGDTLFIFYTETDHDDATSRFEKINLASRQSILKTEIPGFNLGIPYIVDDYAYVTTMVGVGKLNLINGQYVYQHFDLYDEDKIFFNSFDTIIFKDSLTFFLSENRTSKCIDSLIVNEKTGTREIRK